MTQSLLILVIAAVLAAVFAYVTPCGGHRELANWRLHEISVADLNAIDRNVILVDARSAIDFNDFHLQEAVSLPADNWD